MKIAQVRIPTPADIADDMEKIHALHEAHGDKVHCNYCNCQCALCKREGWKYRPESYVVEVLPFEKGEVLRIVEAFDPCSEGSEVVYMGHRGFQVLKDGAAKGPRVTFLANSSCEHLFQRSHPIKFLK